MKMDSLFKSHFEPTSAVTQKSAVRLDVCIDETLHQLVSSREFKIY